MSKKLENVNVSEVKNYALAYRLLLLLGHTTDDRHEGSKLNIDSAYKILGVSQDEADKAIAMLEDDGILSFSTNGTAWLW